MRNGMYTGDYAAGRDCGRPIWFGHQFGYRRSAKDPSTEWAFFSFDLGPRPVLVRRRSCGRVPEV